MFDLYDPLFMSGEAYFGNDNPFATEMLDLVTQLDTTIRGSLQERYSNIFKNKKFSDVELKKFNKIISKIENCIKINTNVEEVEIKFMKDTGSLNMCTVPLITGDNLLENGKLNDKLASQIENITQTSKGYRFKTSKGLSLRYGIGVGLFDSRGPKLDLTPREITAMLFREIGTSFHYIVGGVYLNFAIDLVTLIYRITRFIEDSEVNVINRRDLDKKYKISSKNIKYKYITLSRKLHNAINSKDIKKIKKLLESPEVSEIYEELKTYEKKRSKRKRERVNNPKTKGKGSTKTSKIWSRIGTVFYIILANFSAIFLTILYIYRYVGLFWFYVFYKFAELEQNETNKNREERVDEFHNKVMKERKYLRKEEQFADSFVAAYGFSTDLSSAIHKFQNFIKTNNRRLSKLWYIGGSSFVSDSRRWRSSVYLMESKYETITAGLNGKDVDFKRMANLYKILEYELRTNKSLSKQEIEEIEKTMKSIEVVYENFQNSKRMNFYGKELNNTQIEDLGRTINEIETDIEKNVLDDLQ